jgi:predicted GIY-YIG superfamily endonuclease
MSVYLSHHPPRPGHAIVYSITHLQSGLIYVGYTKQSLLDRWQIHRSDAKLNKPASLYQAMHKFGIDMFAVEELEQCGMLIRRERELDYMRNFESWNPEKGYNPPIQELRYLMKLHFLLNPADAAKHALIWEKRRSIVPGYYELYPLPPGYEWIDEERRELEEKAIQGGRLLIDSISSLASPVVTRQAV